VLIFYPLFTKLEEWVKDLSTKIVLTGKSLAGKYLGLALTLIICLMVLIYFYGKIVYHIGLSENTGNGGYWKIYMRMNQI